MIRALFEFAAFGIALVVFLMASAMLLPYVQTITQQIGGVAR